MLNVKRLVSLAEWLEAGAPHKGGVEKFDMQHWIEHYPGSDGCGTVCCIAGATIQFFNKWGHNFKDYDDYTSYNYQSIDEYAMELLGLSERQADELFRLDEYSETLRYKGDGYYNELMQSITPAWAARTIRHLLATDCVDWEATKA